MERIQEICKEQWNNLEQLLKTKQYKDYKNFSFENIDIDNNLIYFQNIAIMKMRKEDYKDFRENKLSKKIETKLANVIRTLLSY